MAGTSRKSWREQTADPEQCELQRLIRQIRTRRAEKSAAAGGVSNADNAGLSILPPDHHSPHVPERSWVVPARFAVLQ
ncbi:MAG: hypothetical protein ACK48U_00800, partial [Planctomyces sp.]